MFVVKWNYRKLILITFFILLPLIGIREIVDPDYFWHLKIGEWIIKNKNIPFYDSFSYISRQGNILYCAHEWLFDMVLYALYSILGNIGPNLYVYLISLANLYLMYKIVLLKTVSRNTAVFVSLIYFPLLSAFQTPRPMLLSLTLFLAAFYLLELYIRTETNRLWLLPLFSVLLANLHGGSTPVFFVIVFSYLIFNSRDINIGRLYTKKIPVRMRRNIFLWFVISIPVLLLNPYGLVMFKMIYSVLNAPDLKALIEWKSIFSLKIGLAILANMAFPYIILSITRDKIKIIDLFFICAASYLTISAARNIILFAVFNSVSVATYIHTLLPGLKTKLSHNEFIKIVMDYFREMDKNLQNLHKPFITAISLIIILCVAVTYIVLTSSSSSSVYKNYPVGAIEFIENNNIDIDNNIMLNQYGWGGYLIFNNLPVFIDGRLDIYLKSQNKNITVYDDYLSIIRLKQDWNSLLNKYNVKYLLLPGDSALGNVLAESDKWKVLFKDDISVFFEKM